MGSAQDSEEEAWQAGWAGAGPAHEQADAGARALLVLPDRDEVGRLEVNGGYRGEAASGNASIPRRH